MSNTVTVATEPTSEGHEVRIPQQLTDMLAVEISHLREVDAMAYGWMRWYFERARGAHARAEELSKYPGNEKRVEEYRERARDFSARNVAVNVWRGELMECRRLLDAMAE